MRGLALVLAVILSVASEGQPRRRATTPPRPWNASLTLESSSTQTLGGRNTHSSSKLLLKWTPPPFALDHYVIGAVDTAGGPRLNFTAAAGDTSMLLDRLESATEYRASITACFDSACTRSALAMSSATARTDEEVWQIKGTGSTYATAEKLIVDGNTKPWVMVWGNDVQPSTLARRPQLYFDPMGSNEKGVKIGIRGSAITSPSVTLPFVGVFNYGFRRNDSQGRMGTGPATFQVVPLSASMGARVRLFYEAASLDGLGRVWSVDSADGWTGRDFHTGSPTQCQEADLGPGGPCVATLLIGVESDGNPRVRQARQLKVVYPTLDYWAWRGEPGTLMVVTLHLTDTTCSSTFFNMGVAMWDGAKWNVQYDGSGCPKVIPGVQAPMPVHMGGARYKLYFNHNRNGVQTDKPMRLLYADGNTTGSGERIDFEDWEPISRARPITYLWPSGTPLTEAETSMLDDYQIWMPTSDPSFQLMYSNMSCPNNACGAPFIGVAVLMNP